MILQTLDNKEQDMDFEKIAREKHLNKTNCASSVYEAFQEINTNSTVAPLPRDEGGRCGAVLSAEKILREMEIGRTEEFAGKFIERYGSVMCEDLKGKNGISCNDYVGFVAVLLEKMIDESKKEGTLV